MISITSESDYGLDFGNGNYEDLEACRSIENCTYQMWDVSTGDQLGYASVYKLNNRFRKIGTIPMLSLSYTEDIEHLYILLDNLLINYSVWWITDFTINEEHRHKGYGSKLLNFVTGMSENTDDTIIILQAYNLADHTNHSEVVNFYKKNGFVRVLEKDGGSYIMLYSKSEMLPFIKREVEKLKKVLTFSIESL